MSQQDIAKSNTNFEHFINYKKNYENYETINQIDEYGLYDNYKISGFGLKVSQHRLIQRLKQIHQLAGMFFLNDKISHKRYEHCLGVGYLCRYACESLMKKYPNEISKKDIILLELAGIFHDSHLFFSHTTDMLIKKKCESGELKIDKIKQKHEYRSVRITEIVLTDLGFITSNIDNKDDNLITINELRFIQHCIDPNITKELYGECKYKFKAGLDDILNGEHTGFDCDRLDYLYRDSIFLGYNFEKNSTNTTENRIKQILRNTHIIDNHIHISVVDYNDVCNFLMQRASFHMNEYNSERAMYVDLLIAEVLQDFLNYTNGYECILLETEEHIKQFEFFTDINLLNYLNNVKHKGILSRANSIIQSLKDKKDFAVTKTTSKFVKGIENISMSKSFKLHDFGDVQKNIGKIKIHLNGKKYDVDSQESLNFSYNMPNVNST